MASPDGGYAAFYAPSEFVALIREEIPFKEALEMVNERIEESVVQVEGGEVFAQRSARGRLEREDRSGLLSTNPFPERVVKELGLPWKGTNRGRPPVYNQVKLVAAILVKGMKSFAGLAARDTDYVMTVDGSDSKPCPSEPCISENTL